MIEGFENYSDYMMEQGYQHSQYESWLDETEPRRCLSCGYGPVQVERRVIRDQGHDGDGWMCGKCECAIHEMGG